MATIIEKPQLKVTPDEDRAENLLRQNRFFASDYLLKQVLDAMPSMVAILNDGREIIFFNKALHEGLGCPPLEEILGYRPGKVLCCSVEAQSAKGCGFARQCVDCGLSMAFNASRENNNPVEGQGVVHQIGQVKNLELGVKVTPLPIRDQQYFLVALNDITHHKTVKLLERTFFHDILNTAGGVRGLADIIVSAEDQETVEEYSALLVTQSDDLLDAIEAQRDILAAERGQLEVRQQELDSAEVLQSVIDLYRAHPVAEGRKLHQSPDSQQHRFRTGEVLLKRTLGNMVKNALEATEPGQQVTLGCHQVEGETDRIRFWVHNVSVIPQRVQDRLFNRTFSTKGSDRGIGTYSMKLLGETHLGGWVDFRSKEGEGTTFWIELPL
jgi:signal transduction histidine kinase